MASIDRERILEFRGEDLCGRDGEKIGSIEEIYLDADTNTPAWALVNMGLFGTKDTFVPLDDASEVDGTLTVPYDKQAIKDAPDVEATGQLTKQEEAALHEHYGVDRSTGEADT
jgi:sporulation protein YlmC with PRC-barrel domain